MKNTQHNGLSGRILCGVCHMSDDVDDTVYIFPEEKYAPGVCRQCKELPLAIQQAFFHIHLEVNTIWLRAHKDALLRALFSEK